MRVCIPWHCKMSAADKNQCVYSLRMISDTHGAGAQHNNAIYIYSAQQKKCLIFFYFFMVCASTKERTYALEHEISHDEEYRCEVELKCDLGEVQWGRIGGPDCASLLKGGIIFKCARFGHKRRLRDHVDSSSESCGCAARDVDIFERELCSIGRHASSCPRGAWGDEDRGERCFPCCRCVPGVRLIFAVQQVCDALLRTSWAKFCPDTEQEGPSSTP